MVQRVPPLLLFAALQFVPFGNLFAHAEHDVVRYVAPDGKDQGRCERLARICRTIGYAASQAGKGDVVLVAEGSYELTTADEIFAVTSNLVPVLGGYSTEDYFRTQSPQSNPTILLGAPTAYREDLVARGFRLIADRKGARPEIEARSKQLASMLVTMQSVGRPTACVDGSAGGFACSNIDLHAHIPLSGFKTSPTKASDVWGFLDLNTGREYALVGLITGVAVVDVSDPDNPREVDTLSLTPNAFWRDIKVYQYFDEQGMRWRAWAYVTADNATNAGLAIIDLSDLPNSVSLAPTSRVVQMAHNVHISNVDNSLGIALNGMKPMLQLAGSNLGSGEFRTYSLADPANPLLEAVSPGGYMHDAASIVLADSRKDTQCVNADTHCEVLVDFNETTFDIYDATRPDLPMQLSSSDYDNVAYVHSGWVTEDQQYVFVHDELDEQGFGLNTTLRVFDVANLEQPQRVGTWTGPTRAIDHNGFVRGNRYYMSNYTRGLTVLDITDPTTPVEAGRFDTFPVSDLANFNGAWGVYPFLPSGTLLISDINSGLYVLKDNTRSAVQGQFAFTEEAYNGDEGDTLEITVTRSGGTTGAVSVDYETLMGSAVETDFTGVTGRLSWDAGDSSDKTILVELSSDVEMEDIERLFVRLLNPVNGAVLNTPNLASAFVTDVPTSGVEIATLDATISVAEGRAEVMIPVQRKGSAKGVATVAYRTEPIDAVPGEDYVESSGQLTWADGDAASKIINVALINNGEVGAAKQFRVVLSEPEGSIFSGSAITVVTILDDDSAPPQDGGGSGEGAGGGGGGGAAGIPGLLILGMVWLGAWRRYAMRLV